MAIAYYRPNLLHTGRWAVAHPLPGLAHIAGAVAVDVDCRNHAAAARLADQMNAQRQRDARQQAAEHQACGLRWDRPC